MRSDKRTPAGKARSANSLPRDLNWWDYRGLPPVLLLASSFLVVARTGGTGSVPWSLKQTFSLSMQVQADASRTPPSKDDLRLSMIKAVKQGDAITVRRLLAKGADPNSREVLPVLPRADQDAPPQKASEEPLLNLAATQGNIEVVKLLLATGAKVDAPGEAGFTPLMEAVRSRHLTIVTLLLSHSANPNQLNDFGGTAILFVAGKEQDEMLQTLLKAGADIDGGTGWTLLMQAAYNGEEDMVKLLLKQGARVNIKRENLLTPLECALVQNNDTIAAILKAAGGKGRTLKHLRAEEDQESKKEAAEEKARRRATALQYRKERVLTEEDRQVIEVALQELLTVPDDQYIFLRKRSDLLLLEKTASGSGMISDDQINADLKADQAQNITVEMRQGLQHRNSLPISLGDFKPSNAHIRVSKVDSSYSDFAFSEHHPTARGYVQVYLPGYSQNHDRAVLRFGMGPSPHGEAGICFLIQKGGVWHVKWKRFTHYF